MKILIDNKRIVAYINATTITDIYFIAKKEKGHEEAISFLENLLELVDVIGIDKEVIFHAITLKLIDLEDAIQISASELNRIETIITRNKADFRNTSLEVITPKDFLKSIQ